MNFAELSAAEEAEAMRQYHRKMNRTAHRVVQMQKAVQQRAAASRAGTSEQQQQQQQQQQQPAELIPPPPAPEHTPSRPSSRPSTSTARRKAWTPKQHAVSQRKKCTQLAAIQHLAGLGAVRVSLPAGSVMATIASVDEASGYAVAVYTKTPAGSAPVPGAIAIPLGLVSDQCRADLKKRRRRLQAAANAMTTTECQALHVAEHFDGHAGELGLVIRGSCSDTAAARDMGKVAAPTLIGYTCDLVRVVCACMSCHVALLRL